MTLVQKSLKDAGKLPESYYKERLSPLRYKIRHMLIPWVEKESEVLYKIQKSMRSYWLDQYFAWTANLASHTFYVINLPLPFWFGIVEPTRDLVWVLGFGIYFSGVLKDYCCLPRPASPPLVRITMSGYTAQEYGFPSSHSANATSVTIIVLIYYIQSLNRSLTSDLIVFSSLFLYYSSLIFGRIYCGMHGFLDVTVGGLIGVLCVIGRFQLAKVWDPYLLDNSNSHWAIPFIIVFIGVALIVFHVNPVDECPCFDDSVAFIGVLIGLETSSYFFARWDLIKQIVNPNFGITTTVTVPYSFEVLGLKKTVIRVLIGILLVAVWKAISKKVLMSILSKFYSLVITTRPKVSCVAHRDRFDIDIIVRLIVYAGISFCSTVGFCLLVRQLQLDYNPYRDHRLIIN